MAHRFCFALLFATLLSLTALGQAQTRPYTMADLEALARDQAYEEFFRHILDIPPGNRDERWKELLRSMAELQLTSALRKHRLTRADFQSMEELYRLPGLAQDEFYRLKRAQLGPQWLRQCFEADPTTASGCWSDLVRFWENDRQDPDLALKLYGIVAPYLKTPPDLLDPAEQDRRLVSEYFLLRPLLTNPQLAPLQCQKALLQEVLWGEYQRRELAQTEELAAKDLMAQLAHKDCWPHLKEKLSGIIRLGASVPQMQSAARALNSLGQLGELDADLLALSYLLHSPVPGEHFNQSWAVLTRLSRMPARRDRLLEAMKEQRPLAGEVFAHPDELKRRAVTRHLSQHFPEYLNFYAHTCVEFFSGKKAFPQGNPARRCRELFELALPDKTLLSDGIKESWRNSL